MGFNIPYLKYQRKTCTKRTLLNLSLVMMMKMTEFLILYTDNFLVDSYSFCSFSYQRFYKGVKSGSVVDHY